MIGDERWKIIKPLYTIYGVRVLRITSSIGESCYRYVREYPIAMVSMGVMYSWLVGTTGFIAESASNSTLIPTVSHIGMCIVWLLWGNWAVIWVAGAWVHISIYFIVNVLRLMCIDELTGRFWTLFSAGSAQIIAYVGQVRHTRVIARTTGWKM